MNSVKELLKTAKRHDKLAEKYRQAAQMYKDGHFRYRVELESLWSDHGEDGVDLTGKSNETCKMVYERAIEDFKRVNKRSDVQATTVIEIVFPNGIRLELCRGFADQAHVKAFFAE